MKNVMVTGAMAPLGARVLRQLREIEGVEHIAGVESEASSAHMKDIELVSFSGSHRHLLEFLTTNRIDTVIHCGMAPDRDGSPPARAEARVVDTMRLGAAIAHDDSPVRSFVVASSSTVYEVSSHTPLMVREEGDLQAEEGSVAASLLEAEEYARDVAVGCPHLNVAILRLQELIGEGVGGAVSELFEQPILPSVLGFDPPLQTLSIEDAVRALVFAARVELAGVYNLASVGIIRLSEVARELNRFALPVLPLEAGPLASLARRFGVPHVPEGLLPMLRFGNAVDTAKLAEAGFRPEYDQVACIAALRS